MRYWVRIGDRTLEVDLGDDAARLEGDTVPAELIATGAPGVFHLRLPGDAATLVARKGKKPGEWRILIEGRWLEAEVVDERARALRAMAGASPTSTDRAVRAPMPGLVLQLHVAAGDAVEAGQPVAVVEAMKMENVLRAPAAGKVARVHVSPGQTVEKGTVLLLLE